MHLAILFSGPPKPEACWSSRRWGKCKELMLTTAATLGLELNSGSHNFKHWASGYPSHKLIYLFPDWASSDQGSLKPTALPNLPMTNIPELEVLQSAKWGMENLISIAWALFALAINLGTPGKRPRSCHPVPQGTRHTVDLRADLPSIQWFFIV